MQDNDRIATNLGLMSSTFGSVFQAERPEGGVTAKERIPGLLRPTQCPLA